MSPYYLSRYALLTYPRDWGPTCKLLISLQISGMADGVAAQVLEFIEELRGASFAVPLSIPQTHPGRD